MKKDEGVWLRGNLHMHTNRSDGRLAPEEAIAMYEQGGYDFIAVTDHWVYHDGGKTEKGMLLLSGCEYDVGEDVVEGLYHIVSIGAHEKPQIAKREDLGPQEIMRAAYKRLYRRSCSGKPVYSVGARWNHVLQCWHGICLLLWRHAGFMGINSCFQSMFWSTTIRVLAQNIPEQK